MKKFLIILIILFFLYSFFILILLNKKTCVENEKIPFEIKIKKSKFINKNWKIWVKEGKEGYKKIVKEKVYIAGRKLNEKILFKSEILKKPEKSFIIIGDSEKKQPITVPEETYVHYKYVLEATGYDPSPESSRLEWTSITKLGWVARYGIVAVDPKIIPLRSLLYIEGYGFAWAGDTGSDIKGKRIDLCYNTTEEALKWGRRKTNVYVLGKKPLSYYKKRIKNGR